MSYTYYPHRNNAVIDQNTVNTTGRCILNAFRHIMKKPDVLYAVLTNYLSLVWHNQDDVMQFEMALHHYVVQTMKNKVVTRKSVACIHGNQEFDEVFSETSKTVTIFLLEALSEMKQLLCEWHDRYSFAGIFATEEIGECVTYGRKREDRSHEMHQSLDAHIDSFIGQPGYWHNRLYSDLKALDLHEDFLDWIKEIMLEWGESFFCYIARGHNTQRNEITS